MCGLKSVSEGNSVYSRCRGEGELSPLTQPIGCCSCANFSTSPWLDEDRKLYLGKETWTGRGPWKVEGFPGKLENNWNQNRQFKSCCPCCQSCCCCCCWKLYSCVRPRCQHGMFSSNTHTVTLLCSKTSHFLCLLTFRDVTSLQFLLFFLSSFFLNWLNFWGGKSWTVDISPLEITTLD